MASSWVNIPPYVPGEPLSFADMNDIRNNLEMLKAHLLPIDAYSGPFSHYIVESYRDVITMSFGLGSLVYESFIHSGLTVSPASGLTLNYNGGICVVGPNVFHINPGQLTMFDGTYNFVYVTNIGTVISQIVPPPFPNAYAAMAVVTTSGGNIASFDNGPAYFARPPQAKNSSAVFSVTLVGVQTVVIPHLLISTPQVNDCSVTLIQGTPVDDWVAMPKVVSTNTLNVTCKVHVLTASSTPGAVAVLGLKVARR